LSGGFELYVRHDAAPSIWEGLLLAGATPCGLGARDTLRLEAGFCLYGNDIDETTSPIEAGLGWITKFKDDFVDYDHLKAQREQGTERVLRGFKMLERGIPRQGYAIENSAGETIGHITSGTQSPSLGEGIAIGYINRSFATLGEHVAIRIRKNAIPATVVRPGFLPKNVYPFCVVTFVESNPISETLQWRFSQPLFLHPIRTVHGHKATRRNLLFTC